MPRSLMFFVATGVVYVLQFVPGIGIILMFMGAMFWPIVWINAGFVSLAIEAWIGRISRLWLVAPIAWFGGYYAVAALSHMGGGYVQPLPWFPLPVLGCWVNSAKPKLECEAMFWR
jgi:hypothetical protein